MCSIISTTPGGIKVLKGAGLIRVKERSVLFSIYIYIYTSIYIFIYLYTFLYIYCRKKNGMFSRFFAKVRNVLAFFSVLCKRMFRSFPFFAKEHSVLCVLFCSLEKNGKERTVLLGLISRQKLEKRMEKNGTFFF